MGAIVYLTKDELLQYYEDTIVQSGGGMSCIRDLGGLEKTLDFVQNDGYYPEFEDKLIYLVYGLCTGHYFADGNKRISLVAGAHFLLKNGRSWAGFNFLKYMEAYIWHVAAGNLERELLGKLIHAFLTNSDLDEETKLEVIHAMEKSHLYREEECPIIERGSGDTRSRG